ncbi:MAG: 16S rRNA (uracil(1498)-N(3))-methyltransferase [Myxococcales bacterium]|nr:16S rRNA (uracil(1498)-N(3))-methyltransferase [Myxococcales bacterium]
MTIRIFHDGPLVVGDELAVGGDELHYLRRVRRSRVGATIEVLDGRGGVAQGELVHLDERRGTVRVDAAAEPADHDPLELWLGAPEAPACLEAIRGACELGVGRIVLVRCAYSSSTVPNPDRIDRVVRAAMRQCGLPRPPAIVAPTPLPDVLAAHEIPCGHFAWEEARGTRTPVDGALPPRLLVGPEGGLRADEAAACADHGMQPLSLGPWTLRTETATVAGLARLRGT